MTDEALVTAESAQPEAPLPTAPEPTRESPSINERPKLRDTLKAAWNEHQQKPADKSPARSAAATARERDEAGKFAPKEQSQKDGGKEPSPSATNKDSAPQQSAQKTEGQPQAVSDRPAAWGNDKANLWSSLPKEAQDFISKREVDVSKGFAEYGEKTKRLQEIDAVMSPLRPMLQRLGQSDAQGIRTMIGWQQALANPNGKIEALKALAKQLGIDLSTLAPAPQGGQQQQQPDPVTQQLQQILAPTVSRLNEYGQKLSVFEQQRQQESAARANAEINAFAKDHPYLDRARAKMAQLMMGGLATALDDAYNQAIWADPEIRAEIQKSEEAKRDAELKAAQEAERVKHEVAEEERRKRDAEAAAKARRASVSPPSSTPGGVSGGSPKKGQSVRQSLLEAVKETRAGV